MSRLLATTLNFATVLIASAALAKTAQVERLLEDLIHHEKEAFRLHSSGYGMVSDNLTLLTGQNVLRAPDTKPGRSPHDFDANL